MKKENIKEVFQGSEEEENSKLEAFNKERYGAEGLALKNKMKKTPDDFELLMSYNDFGIKLQKKYGKEDCINVMAFHILIGSTPHAGFLELKDYKFDFDGEDSIEKFIDKTLKEAKEVLEEK